MEATCPSPCNTSSKSVLSSEVTIEKSCASQVQLNQGFEYWIKVTNTSKTALNDVTVWETTPAGMNINSSDPELGAVKEGWASWKVGNLAPGESKTVKINATACSEGALRTCAEVTYRLPQLCMDINCCRLAISLACQTPNERLLCDTIPMTFTVKNVGSACVSNVTAQSDLPEGLTTTDGKNSVSIHIGTLKVGESKDYSAELRAAKTGTYQTRVFAMADSCEKVSSESCSINVIQPVLTVKVAAPAERIVTCPVTYNITVNNGPQYKADSTTLWATLPAGARFISATEGGQQSGDKISWNFGTLDPQANRQVSFTFMPCSTGQIASVATATANCATATDQGSTNIIGMSATRLDVCDTSNPICLGGNDTYIITVSNTGSAADTNVAVTATLPAQVGYVDANGPTKATVDGNKITFAPIASLAPRDKVVYKVTVKTNDAGDARFQVNVNSDQLGNTPIMKTESTKIMK
jgi:uncharacterized repeat protein (TIGR01451 family)